MSTSVCDKCHQSLQAFHQFFQLVEARQKSLLSDWETGEVSHPMEVKTESLVTQVEMEEVDIKNVLPVLESTMEKESLASPEENWEAENAELVEMGKSLVLEGEH